MAKERNERRPVEANGRASCRAAQKREPPERDAPSYIASDTSGLLALQEIAGNQAVAQRIRALVPPPRLVAYPSGPAVQRDDDTATVEEDTGEQVADTPELDPASPSKEAPKVPAKIDKTRSEEVLQKAYGAYVTISGGKVVIADQAEFQKLYDGIYGKTQYSWEKYVVPKFGNLEGFADKKTGTSYINSAKQSVDTVPHEMLHTNASSAWKAAVSHQLNEGATEWLTIKAVSEEKYTPTHSYPSQEGVVRDLVAVVGEEALMNAYFKGSVAPVKTKVDAECTGTWDQLNKAMDAADWVKAKALLVLKAKPAAPDAGTK
jgi:hypothetical protein